MEERKPGNSKKTRTSEVVKNPVGVSLRESEGRKLRSWSRKQSLGTSFHCGTKTLDD